MTPEEAAEKWTKWRNEKCFQQHSPVALEQAFLAGVKWAREQWMTEDQVAASLGALREIANNHDGYQTYSGTQCRDIAQAALDRCNEKSDSSDIS